MAIYLGNKKVSMRGVVAVVDNSKFAQMIDGSITEITAKDLEGLTSIGSYAFYGRTNLKKIEIPKNITSLGIVLTVDTPSLEEIHYSGSVGNLGESNNVFRGAGVGGGGMDVIIDDSVTTIPNSLFSPFTSYGSNTTPNIKSIYIGKNVTSIGNYAFANCRNVINIYYNAVNCNNISSYYHFMGAGQNNGATLTIGKDVVRLPTNLTGISISNQSSSTKFTKILFEENSICEEIAGNAIMGGVENITEITIPSSVKSIGSGALRLGSSTNKVTVRMLGEIPPSISTSSFTLAWVERIEVPMSALETYKSATNWSAIADIIVGY